MLEQLTGNWTLKLLALGLAFGIWVSVTGETSIVQDFSPPLDIRLPENHTLASEAPTTVTVRLRGTETAIRMMDELLLGVQVDLRDGTVGERDVPLTERNLTGIPRGVEMDFINPDRLNVVVDRRVRLRLPVEPTFIGKLPDGMAFYGAEVRPKKLVVEGPAGEVEALESLATSPLRLDNLTEPVTMTAVAVTEGSYLRIADPEPLEVRIIVDATPVERRYSKVPVQVTGSAYSAVVAPTTVDVTLAGPPSLLDSIDENGLLAVINIAELGPGTSDAVPVTIEYRDLPVEDRSRVTVNSIAPESIDVRVAEEEPQA